MFNKIDWKMDSANAIRSFRWDKEKNSADARHLLSLAAVNFLFKGTVQPDGSSQN
jgi:hypothetical protein